MYYLFLPANREKHASISGNFTEVCNHYSQITYLKPGTLIFNRTGVMLQSQLESGRKLDAFLCTGLRYTLLEFPM